MNKYHKKLTNIQENESIKQIIRKSLLAYFLNTFSDLFLILLGWWLVYLSWIWLYYGDLKIHPVELIILIIFWAIVLWIWLYFRYNTYLLITTHRIEKHKPTYLFWEHKEILWYHEINKISYSYPSLIAKFLDYGTLEIIAGESEKNNILFEQAPHPEKLTQQLRLLKKQEK